MKKINFKLLILLITLCQSIRSMENDNLKDKLLQPNIQLEQISIPQNQQENIPGQNETEAERKICTEECITSIKSQKKNFTKLMVAGFSLLVHNTKPNALFDLTPTLYLGKMLGTNSNSYKSAALFFVSAFVWGAIDELVLKPATGNEFSTNFAYASLAAGLETLTNINAKKNDSEKDDNPC